MNKEVIVGALYWNITDSINKAEAEVRTSVEYVEDPEYIYTQNGIEFHILNDFALCKLNKPVLNKKPIHLTNNVDWPPVDTKDLHVIGLGKL